MYHLDYIGPEGFLPNQLGSMMTQTSYFFIDSSANLLLLTQDCTIARPFWQLELESPWISERQNGDQEEFYFLLCV
jgi:hypothetical protein